VVFKASFNPIEQKGNIPDKWVFDQIKVLNKDYKGVVHFKLQKINRVENAAWFKTKIEKKANGPGEKAEVAMKQALREGGARTLNVYSVKSTDKIAGWATLPVDCLFLLANHSRCRRSFLRRSSVRFQHASRRKLEELESWTNVNS
jgi:hypothetical protein